MTPPRIPLPLPPMVFRDVHFEVVYVDEEPCLRADQIGQALVYEPPEPKVLELYQVLRGHFSDFITRVVTVTLETGPRPMRVFTLWGTLSLAKRASTPEAPDFEAWITELMMIRGYSLQWEVIRLHGENADLWGRLNETEARYRLVSMQIEELKAKASASEPPAPLDADYRRLSEEQAEQARLLRSLVGQVSGFLERLPDEMALAVEDARLFAIADDLQAGLGPLAAAVKGLQDRLDKALRPPARRGAAKAAQKAGADPGVAALAAPEFQFMGFDYRDGPSLTALLFRERPAPWFLAADLRPLLGLAGLPSGQLAAEVERIVPEPHRDLAGDGFPIVDPVGADALLWAWGDPFGNAATEEIWTWIAGTVLPSLHAAMLRAAQLDPAAEIHPGFPRAPTEVAAEGPFKVYRGELDGRPCLLAAGRDLHRFLALGWRPFGDWWRDKLRWAAWLEGRDFYRVYVQAARYDPYLSLDAALACLLSENSPKKAEAEEFLLRVARGQPGTGGATIEGEARRVEEGTALPAAPAFPDEGLVTVAMGEIGGKPSPICNARDLHRFLAVGRDFSNWIKDRLAEYGFAEGEDYSPILANRSDGRAGKRRIDYHLTLDTAKELAMVEKTPQGRKIRRYFIRCEKLVLSWHKQAAAHNNSQSARLASASLPDTPPHEPLLFEYLDEKGRPVPIRVAVRRGVGWAAAPGIALALGDCLANLEQACARIPRSWIGSMPSPSGESVDLALSEPALGYLFGQRAHQGPAMAFRAWWFQEVEPVLRGGGTGRVEAAAKPTGNPEPAEMPDREEHRGPEQASAGEAPEAMAGEPLRARFEALTLWRWRKQGRKTHAEFPGCVAILVLLWEEAGDGEWLAAGTRGGFARRLGMTTGKSAEAALQRLRDWGLVEFRPEGAGWPEAIRLHLDNLAAGLEACDGEYP